jgi:hypothetical protein
VRERHGAGGKHDHGSKYALDTCVMEFPIGLFIDGNPTNDTPAENCDSAANTTGNDEAVRNA